MGIIETDPDRKVCDNILERRHTPHRLRQVVLSRVALIEKLVSFWTIQQEMGHEAVFSKAKFSRKWTGLFISSYYSATVTFIKIELTTNRVEKEE